MDATSSTQPLTGAQSSTRAEKLYELPAGASILAAVSYRPFTSASSRTLHCEASASAPATDAPKSIHDLSLSTKRLPIYDQPEPPVTLVETHTELERQIGSLRRSLQSSTTSLQSSIQNTTSGWISRERAVEARLRSIFSVPEEPANPNLLYVGVATLSASVFTRYRSFPIRFLAPPLFFVGSLNYFLPKTSSNLAQYYLELENRYFPSLTGPRQGVVDASHRVWNRTEGLVESARDSAAKGVKSGLEQVEKGTGLRVGDVVSQAKAGVAEVKDGRRLV
ncbi:hypothetical protein OC846_001461 [Tilletia horrida]|uniref:MICOS complex subunit n=1 Tax=Tilletia horrida TaxID=155126 RepID=A0AAN6GTA1_9BASI|nr:hypothetical protein OC846_001461 [Tilletia horrida]KAK0569011.1 hypothetical protein OC861_001352 [Tilletia horrida]